MRSAPPLPRPRALLHAPVPPVSPRSPARSGLPDKMQGAQLLRGTNTLNKSIRFYLQFEIIWVSCTLYAKCDHPDLDPRPSLGAAQSISHVPLQSSQSHRCT